MSMAKVTTKGQITIPKEIRKKMGLEAGDHVLFIEDESGKVFLVHASVMPTQPKPNVPV